MIERAAVPLARVRVCVAVPTYRRPQMLADALAGLGEQSLSAEYEVTVLVIDNDGVPSARSVVGDAAKHFPFGLRYRHFPEPGLSAIRNAALHHARDGFEYIAMLDDDERPDPLWLGELLRVGRATRADVVIGPVPQRLPLAAPRWLRAGRFLDLPTFPDGAPLSFGYSGNCLLRTSSLERFGVTFDAGLNFAGGEDLLFFRELVARGAAVRFAARAVASETVGLERLRASYILRLYFRRGNTLAICDRRLNAGYGMAVARLLKGLSRIVIGGATFLPRTMLRGRAGALRSACDVATGFGSLLGLSGYVFQAYKRGDAARR